jgi:triphosphoribosyl-dephospho-CoA synthase
MRFAEERDLIARQFSRNYVDILDSFLPTLSLNIGKHGDVLWGIRQAQLDLLAQYPDSLIGRKCGAAVATAVSLRADEIRSIQAGNSRSDAEQAFDAWLRADGNRLNPGTTADLIAAGLFLLLGLQSVDRT